MHNGILDLGAYHQLIRITRDDEGNEMNWVGYFRGLDGRIAEGFAHEAILENGRPKIQKVREGLPIRLYREHITYTELGYFLCRRPSDAKELRCGNGQSVLIPCIAIESVKEEYLDEEPQFISIPRHIVVLRPAIKKNRPAISISYRSEKVRELA